MLGEEQQLPPQQQPEPNQSTSLDADAQARVDDIVNVLAQTHALSDAAQKAPAEAEQLHKQIK